MQRPPKYSIEERQGLRQDLVATVYNQTTAQLLIYQRGLRLNATTTTADPDRAAAATQPESRKCSLAATKRYANNKVQGNEGRNMPSEKLLNEIKLERELATLRRIYAVAYEELITDIKDRTVQSDSKDKRGVEDERHSNENKNESDKKDESITDIDVAQKNAKYNDEKDENNEWNGNKVKHENKENNQKHGTSLQDDISGKNNWNKKFQKDEKDQEIENDQKDAIDQDESNENIEDENDEMRENYRKPACAHAILRTAIEAQREDNNEEQKLLSELRHNQATLKAQRAQIDAESSDGAARMAAKEERTATLRHNLRNVRRVNDLEVDLVERWEQNRFTQATIVGENDERALLQQTLALKQRLGGEQRIICEVQNFNAKQFAELRAKISEWQCRYADELARKQAAIVAQELRIAEVRKSHERHRQTYEERRVFVREYLAAKAEQLRLYEAQMHRVECAVRIQAWWRGVMVRRGLGPYRKKSKKGKKGKAKAK